MPNFLARVYSRLCTNIHFAFDAAYYGLCVVIDPFDTRVVRRCTCGQTLDACGVGDVQEEIERGGTRDRNA